MTEQEKDLEVIAALKTVAYDQAPPEFWDVIEREVKAGQKLEDATDIYGEILIDVMAYALLPSPEVAKHGSHDQSSHGRKGSGSESDADVVARMGKEFEAKRSTGEPIAAIKEIASRDDYADFISNNGSAMGLTPGEREVLTESCRRIRLNEERRETAWTLADEETRTKFAETTNTFLTEGTVMAAVPRPVALQVLARDRYKSQFETETSGGALAAGARARDETAMFLVHPGLTPSARPTYGYLSVDAPGAAGPNRYGPVRFELSEDVAARTTMSMGDSLGHFAAPVPVGSSVDTRTAFDTSGYLNVGKTASVGTFQEFGYAETQTMGGWSISDVTKVHLPSSWRGTDVDSAARETGIPVEYYD